MYGLHMTPHPSPVVSVLLLKQVKCRFLIIAIMHYGNTFPCVHIILLKFTSLIKIWGSSWKKQNSRNLYKKLSQSHTILTPIWLGKTQELHWFTGVTSSNGAPMVPYLFKCTGMGGGGRWCSEVRRSIIRVYISQPVKHNLIFKANLQHKRGQIWFTTIKAPCTDITWAYKNVMIEQEQRT